MKSRILSNVAGIALACSAFALFTQAAQAQTVSAPFAADYVLADLGPVSSLPFPYGGLTFKVISSFFYTFVCDT